MQQIPRYDADKTSLEITIRETYDATVDIRICYLYIRVYGRPSCLASRWPTQSSLKFVKNSMWVVWKIVIQNFNSKLLDNYNLRFWETFQLMMVTPAIWSLKKFWRLTQAQLAITIFICQHAKMIHIERKLLYRFPPSSFFFATVTFLKVVNYHKDLFHMALFTLRVVYSNVSSTTTRVCKPHYRIIVHS